MSWNNVIPWYIYELEQERLEAKMLCAFEEEFLSARTRSTHHHPHIFRTFEPLTTRDCGNRLCGTIILLSIQTYVVR